LNFGDAAVTVQRQQEDFSYEFWEDVRKRLAEWKLADPGSAIARYREFVTHSNIPWDLVYHQGADATARSVLDAEREEPLGG
jgi:hypothetical protein